MTSRSEKCRELKSLHVPDISCAVSTFHVRRCHIIFIAIFRKYTRKFQQKYEVSKFQRQETQDSRKYIDCLDYMAFSLAAGEILPSYADAAVTKLMSKVWSNWLTEARFFLCQYVTCWYLVMCF